MKLITKTRYQEVWVHNGKQYSLVDQYKVPDWTRDMATTPEAQDSLRRVEAILRSTQSHVHGSKRYEVADVTDHEIKVRGRYATKKEARARILSGEVDSDSSFWS